MFKRVLVLSSVLLMFSGFSAWGDNITNYCVTTVNGIFLLDGASCQEQISAGASLFQNQPFTVSVSYGSTASSSTTPYSKEFTSFQNAVATYSNNGLPTFDYKAQGAFILGTAKLAGVNFDASYWFGPYGESASAPCGSTGCTQNFYFGYTAYDGVYLKAQFSSGKTYQPTASTANTNNASSAVPPNYSTTDTNGIITGTDNESLADVLKDWLKSSAGQSFLTSYLQTRVAVAPFDPVAGNPSSYMGQAVQENYTIANLVNFQTHPTGGLNLFNMTPQYSIFNADGVTQNMYSLPLRDVYYINDTNSLVFDMPISYTDTSGSSTYAVSVGAAYVHSFALPHAITWSVSPSLHVGADGSEDFASATLIYNGGLSSNIVVPVNQFSFGLTDNVTYLQTAAVNISGYETAYDMNDTLTENGVDVNYAINPKFSVGTNFSNTYLLAGDTWYIDNYNQAGLSVSLNKDYKGTTYNFVTLGASYLFAPHFNGANINVGLNF